MNLQLTRAIGLGLLLVAGCQSTTIQEANVSHAAILTEWMTGSFSSQAQSLEQPEDFYDIRLYMAPIWTERTDGHWLYVEQAAASALRRPYRQRVYHIVDTPDGPRSEVYTLPGNPRDLAGAWRDPRHLDIYGPEDLAEREGCAIYLTPGDGAYGGATRGKGCSSTLGGAAYATSEVTITRDVVTSWDRGFDSNDEQAWGAVLGPYVFLRE